MRMRAAVSRTGSAHPVIETLELEAPRADEVLVRIVAVGICHTDLRMHAGLGPAPPKPVVLGHEGAGIVEKIGAGVTTLQPGDHVVLSGASCGDCPSCRANLPGYCRENMPRNFAAQRMDGSTALTCGSEPVRTHFFGQSSFAQYALAQERTAVKVPQDLPLETLGPLACGVITGTGAVLNSLALRAGESFAVIGAGGVGLSAVMAARIAGAARIVAVDVVPARLELAKELGATHTVLVDVADKSFDPAARVRELAGGGVDASLTTVSDPDAYTHVLACLGYRGRAGFVTAPRGAWSPAMQQMLVGGRRLQGIVGGDAAPHTFIPMLIDFHRQGRLPFDRLLRFYAFEDIALAFDDMHRGVTIKPVLRVAA